MRDLGWVEGFQLVAVVAWPVDLVGIQIGTWDSSGRKVAADPDSAGVVETDGGCLAVVAEECLEIPGFRIWSE